MKPSSGDALRPYSVAGLANGPGQRANKVAGTCHLYFVTMAQFPFVKVGKTRNLMNRLAQLQNATPFVLTLEASFVVTDDRLEFDILNKLAPFSIGNEWFYRSAFITAMAASLKAAPPEAIEHEIIRWKHEPITNDMRNLDHPDFTLEILAKWLNP